MTLLLKLYFMTSGDLFVLKKFTLANSLCGYSPVCEQGC